MYILSIFFQHLENKCAGTAHRTSFKISAVQTFIRTSPLFVGPLFAIGLYKESMLNYLSL